MRTHKRVLAVAAAVVLATSISACGDGSGPSPVRPTPPVTPPAAPTPSPPATLYTLSGVVFEVTSAGNTPVEGVEVYCEPCGPPDGHSLRQTDAKGAYSFDGPGGVASTGMTVIWMLVAKKGYVLPGQPDGSGPNGDGWMGTVNVTVAGDTRYDIQIIRK